VRILVVEDEPGLAEQLASALGQAGYAVDRATDGRQADERRASPEPATPDLGRDRIHPTPSDAAKWELSFPEGGHHSVIPVPALTAGVSSITGARLGPPNHREACIGEMRFNPYGTIQPVHVRGCESATLG